MINSTSLTEEQLKSVDGMSLRDAAQQLGVGKTTIGDARELRARNGGRLPRSQAAQVTDSDEQETYSETYKDNEGEITVVIHEDLAPEDILRKFGRDPEKIRIVGVLEETHWQFNGVDWNHRYKFRTEKIVPDEGEDLTIKDLPLLYSRVNAPFFPSLAEPIWDPIRATVVVWADPQTGKRDSRGGTPELIERMAAAKRKLITYLEDYPAPQAAFLSVGDEVESFENIGAQAFTNDLSFPDQLDLELTFELDFIRVLAANHPEVVVAGTSSNHCAWRRGKDTLGKPSDDYGLYLKRQLEKALRLNEDYDHVTFVHPPEWDETNAVTVAGTKIAMAHGHQVNNPNQITDWWKKQAFGRQSSADADILLTGHFHHFRMEEVIGGEGGIVKPRTWIQAPTMDNGSSWVRNKWGNDSTPGILVFQVTPAGIDMQTLTLL